MLPILGRVDAERIVFGFHDADLVTVFEGPELLQAFGFFERSDGEVRVAEQEVAPVDIESDVLEVSRGIGVRPPVGNGGAGKINRVVGGVRNDFDDVGVEREFGNRDAHFERSHDDAVAGFVGRHGVGAHHAEDAAIDGGGIEGRFVALNVDDPVGVGGRGGLGDAVRTRDVVGARHKNTGLEGLGGFAYALVVGRDDDVGQISGLRGSFPDVFQHGFAGYRDEDFTGKAGRSIPGWDNAKNALRHNRR